jgi:signal transduction histidine kinase/ribosomal protein L40E
MSDQPVCSRCGFTAAPEAHYCARCGRALVRPRARLASATGFWLDRLPSRLVGLAGLIVSIPIGLLVHHLLVNVGLHFGLAHLAVAAITGGGSGYVGWQWGKLPSNRSRLARIGLVFLVVMLLLVGVWLVDREVTGLLVAQGRRVASDIPGVHVEAVGGARGIRVINAPSYDVIAVLYMLVAGVVGGLASRVYTTFKTRQREVDDLRKTLLGQVQDAAAQQERNRLARELHDSIKQQIFSITMSAAAIEANWETNPDRAQTALGDLRSVAHEAMVEMNALLQQLSPAPLEKVGLIQALRDQCEALGYRTGAAVTADFGDLPPDDRLPAGAQESIFRIVQEAFSNTARHARAGTVTLSLGQGDSGGVLVLEIRDDGQGFDPKAVRSGMGLDNIRQRVAALRGDLSIESDVNQGTALRVTVPTVKSVTGRSTTERKQNHILNKVCLVGVAGGLALIAALFYPLYVVLPGGYVDGWLAGSPALSLLLETIAALLVAATGYLAARWARPASRQAGALFGALAGGTAGLVAYLGIGAAAAGVVGSGALLRQALVPVAGDGELARLAIDTTGGVVWWSHVAFWVSILAGVGLGAVGGLLPPAGTTPSRVSLRPAVRVMLIPGISFSTLLLMFNVMVFSALGETIRTEIATGIVSLDAIFPPQIISLWPIGSAAVFFLLPLVALYYISRDDANSSERTTLNAAEAMSGVLGLLSFGMATFLLLTSPGLSISLSSPLGTVVVLTAAASLVLGGGYLAMFVKVRQQKRALGLVSYPPVLQFVAVAGVLWSLAMIAWGVSLPLSWGAIVGVIVAAVDIVLLVALRRQARHPTSRGSALAGLRSTASQLLSTGVGSALAMVLPLAATDSSGVSLFTILTRANGALGGYDMSAFTMADLVRDAYLAQARLALAMLAGGAAAVGLLVLAFNGIIAFVEYRMSIEG